MSAISSFRASHRIGPVLNATPGLELDFPVVWVPARDSHVHLDEQSMCILRKAMSASLPIASLASGSDGAVYSRLSLLIEQRLVSIQFGHVNVFRVLLRCLVAGSVAELRLLVAASARVLDVPPGASWIVFLKCVALILRALSPVLACGSALLAVVAFTLTGRVDQSVDASLVPWMLFLTCAAHEAGHLVTLRRRTSVPLFGALLVSGLRLSVLRPRLPQPQLRRVAAAGPVAGALVALPVVLLVTWAPACGFGGMIALALHLGNLLPCAPDGASVFATEDDPHTTVK